MRRTPARTIEWTSTHSDGEPQQQTAEALMLSGEEVPVELTAEVQFRIADLNRFLFAASRPETMVARRRRE